MSKDLKSKLAVGLLRILGKLPLWLLRLLAFKVFILLMLVPNKTVAQTQLNIRRCWPTLSQRAQKKLVRQSVLQTVNAALEMGLNWTCKSDNNLKSVVHVKGQECLEQAVNRGGVVLITPHLGNWELFANWAAHQCKVTALYTPAKLPGLDQLIYNARSKAGMALAPASAKGVMQLKRALVKSEVVLILPDQEPKPPSGIKSFWFGQPAYTMTLAAQLTKTKSTQVVLGFAKRLPLNQGFAIELEDITQLVEKASHQDTTDDVVVLENKVQAINDAIEVMVRSAPQQYQWEYNRFKHIS